MTTTVSNRANSLFCLNVSDHSSNFLCIIKNPLRMSPLPAVLYSIMCICHFPLAGYQSYTNFLSNLQTAISSTAA